MDKTKIYLEVLNKLKKGEIYKIAFIGDSLTSCEWIHPNWRDIFEYILKFSFEEFKGDDWWIPEWNIKFFNYSLDGGTTKHFISNVIDCENEIGPDMYIIMGTSNDYYFKISPEQGRKNIEKIFDILKDKQVIYSPDIKCNDPEYNKTDIPYIEEVLKISFPKNVLFVNGYEISKKFNPKKIYTLVENGKIDQVHPNVLGNGYIAEMFLENIFGIKIDIEKYLDDVSSNKVKFPRWK